jgi:hypothetical protein
MQNWSFLHGSGQRVQLGEIGAPLTQTTSSIGTRTVDRRLKFAIEGGRHAEQLPEAALSKSEATDAGVYDHDGPTAGSW